MPENNEFSKFPKLDALVAKLWQEPNKRKSLDIGIEVANELMHILGIDESELLTGEDALNEAFPNSKFKNQKMEKWFERHPFYGSGRVALYHYRKNTRPIESNFYWLNESATKARISATTQLFANWEDGKLTMKPDYNVGIDFFLNADANSLLMVVTKEGNLRVIEFSERLSHTQLEILNHIQGCALYDGIDAKTGEHLPYEPQRTIHQTLWSALELSEVNKQFYSGIADQFTLLCQHLVKNKPDGISQETMKEGCKIFSSRLIGRLLFIWFLRKKGIVNKSFDYFNTDGLEADEYYEKKLKVLFFNTLNTPINKRLVEDKTTPYLNGGLFDAHENDWADKHISFPTGWFESLYKHLNKFNFTTDESSPEYEQVAIDPEMLGRVFENLLASIVPETSQAANERKNKGAFYTPREIVHYMCKESLRSHIKNYLNNEKDNYGVDRLIDMNDSDFLMSKSTGISELWGARSEIVKTKIIESINQLKILDPACGSGAFPIGLMQLIIKTLERLTAYYDDSIGKFRLGKPNEKNDTYKTKLFIIRNTLYGSDLEPMAIEISKLRAWLSLIVDDDKNVEPLPNLDFNFVCSNSLIHLQEVEQYNLFADYSFEDSMKELRNKYFNAHSREEKNTFRKQFADLLSNNLSELGNTNRASQLKTWNPFLCDKPALFFDAKYMFDIDGFDIVIGNPPYIQLQSMKKESKELYKPMTYYSSYEAMGDIYTLFYEMGLQNLKSNGTLCYITSNKWMRAGYGQSLRDKVFSKYQIEYVIDLGSDVFESATVDTNIIVIKDQKPSHSSLAVTLDHSVSKSNMSDFIKQNAIEISFKKGEPWVILTKIEQQIKEKIEKYGIPLGKWPDIKINYGIKTGCNEAFIISSETRADILKGCSSKNEYDKTDNIIRPILRGRDIKQGSYKWAGLYLIALVPSKHYKIEEFPAIKHYLEGASWSDEVPKGYGKLKLEQTGKSHVVNGIKFTSRKATGNKWFETQDQIAYMDDFDKQKILYSETNNSDEIKMVIDNEQMIPDKTLFIITFGQLDKLYSLLLSPIFKWYMKRTSPLLGEKGISMTKDSVLRFYIPKSLSIDGYNLTQQEIDYIKEE